MCCLSVYDVEICLKLLYAACFTAHLEYGAVTCYTGTLNMKSTAKPPQSNLRQGTSVHVFAQTIQNKLSKHGKRAWHLEVGTCADTPGL